MMEMAKVTSKGQITIPISIRRRLGIDEGDKLLFINKQDGVLMVNPDAVGDDLSEHTADSIPLDDAAAAPPSKAATGAKPSGGASKPAASSKADASEPDKPPKRKYIPPTEEPEEKPPQQAGGINLSTLLDDIRSIGSNI